MLAIGADKALGDVSMGSSRDAARLRFALNGELGYGQPQRLDVQPWLAAERHGWTSDQSRVGLSLEG